MKRYILRNKEIRQRAMSEVLKLTLDPSLPPWEVTIREHRKDRSLEQNAYMWRLHQAASEEIGHSVDELHHYCCARFLGVKAVMINDRFLNVPYTTTCGPDGKKLTVSAMAKFITECEVFYVEQGIRLDKVFCGEEGANDVRSMEQQDAGKEKETTDNERGSS